MTIEEVSNLTIKEIGNYIAVMNKLVEKEIIKFDKEKAYVEFYADKCISHLEKQNIQLQNNWDCLKQYIEDRRSVDGIYLEIANLMFYLENGNEEKIIELFMK